MAPVKSIPFRIVTEPHTEQVGERIEFEENIACITSIKKIEFLPGDFMAVIGLCREVQL